MADTSGIAGRRLPNWLEIFWASALLLFAELALIRWLPSEMHIFGFFKNMVLIVGFLGGGIGMLSSKKPARLFLSLASLLAVIWLAGGPVGKILGLAREASSELRFAGIIIWPGKGWTGPTGEVAKAAWAWFGLIYMGAVLSALVAVFIPLGRKLGQAMREAKKPLSAYGWNLAGSIAGTWLLSLCSGFALPPAAWFAVTWLGYMPWLSSSRRTLGGWIAAGIIILGVATHPKKISGDSGQTLAVKWSVYQKLVLSKKNYPDDRPGSIPYYAIETNGSFFQYMLDLSTATVAANRKHFGPGDTRYDYYELPYRFAPNAKKVLILGAGSGNDAAAALRNGVRSVDAVEIDPWIVRFGKQYHPERPYTDPRVNIITDDARAFLSRSTGTYDVVVLGLLDSHTSASETLAMNLDFFVYTKESFEKIKRLLAPNGMLYLAFQLCEKNSATALVHTLQQVYKYPVNFRAEQSFIRGPSSQLVFICHDDPLKLLNIMNSDSRLPRLMALKKMEGPEATMLSDDWPYLYIGRRNIPNHHIFLGIFLLIIIGGALLLVFPPKKAGGLRFDRSPAHIESFFLGAAFLLMETYLISRLFLLYGSTWWVNVGAVTGVLVMNFAANMLVLKRVTPGSGAAYGVLGLLLVSQMAVSAQSFLGSAALVIAGTAYYCLPFLCSGMAFSDALARSKSADSCLGMNLLGAVVGGLASMLIFLVGFTGIVAVCMVFYLAAYLLGHQTGMLRTAKRHLTVRRISDSI